MTRTIILSLLFISFLTTEAKCDRFIYNGDTINISSKHYLEQYPNFKSLRAKLPKCYRAEWSIIDNSLFLSNIYTCATADSHLAKNDLNKLFNISSGKIKASWINDTLWMPTGKPIHYYSGVEPLYEGETRLLMINGNITLTKTFNYANAEEKLFSKNPDMVHYQIALRDNLYLNINWAKLPDLSKRSIKFTYSVETTSTGQPKIIQALFESDQSVYNNEVRKAIGQLKTGVYYKHGKFVKEKYFIELSLNEENKKKHMKH